jgi:hypothetical protein
LEEVGKAQRQCVKWASVTQHRWLPSKSKQVAGARAWGCIEDWLETDHTGRIDVSPLFVDDVRKVKRTTNWWPKLEERDVLFRALSVAESPADQVFFFNPLCVGFTEKMARETIDRIWKHHAMVYIHSEGTLYKPGDDLDDFFEQLRKDIKAAQMRDYREK